jgi:ribose 5-phosphate isomerase B
MKIAIGADHAGFSLKEHLRRKLSGEGYEVVDFGTGSLESCDYPDFAGAVGRDRYGDGGQQSGWGARRSRAER